MTEPTHLDGNAITGAFTEVLGFDVSTAILTCCGCDAARTFAETQAYVRAPGIVVLSAWNNATKRSGGQILPDQLAVGPSPM